jgi:hypothetical protein
VCLSGKNEINQGIRIPLGTAGNRELADMLVDQLFRLRLEEL